MDATRDLLIIADDFGIGPETSRGILELAARGLVTGTALLVTSPHAALSVAHWQREGKPVELGWHPCLTLDSPVSPPDRVPTLVNRQGEFWSLGAFLHRLQTGGIGADEVRAELHAQYQRFLALVGQRPSFVNTHQHVAIFEPIGSVLLDLLQESCPSIYVRPVREPWRALALVGGARSKRLLLNFLGRRQARHQSEMGFLGADWLIGLSRPSDASQVDFFTRWLARTPGQSVELMCHPGYLDISLEGRDGTPVDGVQASRVEELQRLCDPRFLEACARFGFRRIAPSEWLSARERGLTHAA